MSRPIICDNCKEALSSPEHWQAEQTGEHVFGHRAGPLDFCNLACLGAWASDMADRQKASALHDAAVRAGTSR